MIHRQQAHDDHLFPPAYAKGLRITLECQAVSACSIAYTDVTSHHTTGYLQGLTLTFARVMDRLAARRR